MTMKPTVEIPAGEFKAKCLKLMDKVARSREPIVITKRGKPVAKLVPMEAAGPRAPLFGYLAGSAEIRGDIVSAPEAEWAVLSGEEDALYADLPQPAAKGRVVRSRLKRRRK